MAGNTRKVQKPGAWLWLQCVLYVLRQGFTLQSDLAFNLPLSCLTLVTAGVTNVCCCAWLPLYFSDSTHRRAAFLNEGYCAAGGLGMALPGSGCLVAYLDELGPRSSAHLSWTTCLQEYSGDLWELLLDCHQLIAFHET